MKFLSKVFLKNNFLKLKVRVVDTVFSLSKPKGLELLFRNILPLLVIFSSGLVRVSSRLRHFHKFYLLLVKTYSNHGAKYTVLYLKSCHVALQRYISGNPFRSLRTLEPDLPLPRLKNGLPNFIGSMDRAAIRNRHAPTVRLWLTILSIYRVLDAPHKWNTDTITKPYGGSVPYIDVIVHNLHMSLPSWRRGGLFVGLAASKLSARYLKASSKAGPNLDPAWTAVLPDALSLFRYRPTYKAFIKYLEVTGSSELLKLFQLVLRACQYELKFEKNFKQVEGNMVNDRAVVMFPKRIIDGFDFDVKMGHVPYYRNGVYTDLEPGRIVGLPEPAGKLRIIALVDMWTQSALKPLHDSLFAILRKIPNDGTFDQDLSVKRGIEKAKASNQAYSVDLSAATDRLPIILQEGILNVLYGNLLGSVWRSMLNRPFINRTVDPAVSDHTYVRYATGTPMGCLSSWAMLAITHHIILQHCCQTVLKTDVWHECYEILGDDLVIFNKDVYLEYVRVMSLLDVGTNPSKSLISESSATFEFAKRTVMDGIDVSGLSWQQFISTTGLKMRLNLIIHLGSKGLVWSDGLLARLITFTPHLNKKALSKESSSLLMMSIISYLANKGLISYVHAVAYAVDPSKGGDFYKNLVDVPVKQMLHDIVSLLLQISRPVDVSHPTELLTLSRIMDRLLIGAERIVGPIGRTIYNEICAKIDSYNDSVHRVTEFVMYQLIPETHALITTPWDQRTERMYKLDNMLRLVANSLLWHDSGDASDTFVDLNEGLEGIPPLEEIFEFRKRMTVEFEKFNFLKGAKASEVKLVDISWLSADLASAGDRIAAEPVLDNIINTADEAVGHDPFVGTWDVIIPGSQSKTPTKTFNLPFEVQSTRKGDKASRDRLFGKALFKALKDV